MEFSEDTIRRKSREFAELADHAGLGLATWKDFNAAFVELFPGCSSSLFVSERSGRNPLAVETDGFPTEIVDEYIDHYGVINPWNSVWPGATLGEPISSSQIFPSATFAHTEFYNDWLLKTGTVESIGMRLSGVGIDQFNISIMLPKPGLAQAEKAILQIYKNISGSLVRAVDVNRLLAEHIGKSVAAAALVERSSDCCFVVDQHLAVVDANDTALSGFRRNDFLSTIGGLIRIRDDEADKWLRAIVGSLMSKKIVLQNKTTSRHKGKLFQLSVSLVPEHDAMSAGYFIRRKLLAFVTVRELSARSAVPDHNILARTFGLSPAEIRLCRAMVEGSTLHEAAEQLSITRETVRHRIKQIFQKTGTNRQSELVALLLRFL